jgi:hypothetical protein
VPAHAITSGNAAAVSAARGIAIGSLDIQPAERRLQRSSQSGADRGV